MTADEIIASIDGQISAKRVWISTHGHKRPPHEKLARERELHALEAIVSWAKQGLAKKRGETA